MGVLNFPINWKKFVMWYGILSAVFYGLMTCTAVAGSLYFFFMLITRAHLDEVYITIGCSCLPSLYFCLISFFFSVLLIMGIKKNRPALVKGHLVHRTVIAVLMTGASFAIIALFRLNYPIYCISLALLSMYKIFTTMVMWIIHKKLTDFTSYGYYNQQHLDSNPNNNQYVFIRSK